MPRYFFTVHDGSSIDDAEGTELLNLAAAKKEAVRYAGALLSEDKGDFWQGQDWHMEVSDEDGLVLLRLDFAATESPAAN